MEMLTSA